MIKLVNFVFKDDKIVIKKYQEDGENIVVVDDKNPKLLLLPDDRDVNSPNLKRKMALLPVMILVTEEEEKEFAKTTGIKEEPDNESERVLSGEKLEE